MPIITPRLGEIVVPFARDQHIRVHTYIVIDTYRVIWPNCPWCDNTPRLAVLSWWWNRWDSPVNGCADSCVECRHTVIDIALNDGDGDPDGITVEYPEPDPTALALVA